MNSEIDPFKALMHPSQLKLIPTAFTWESYQTSIATSTNCIFKKSITKTKIYNILALCCVALRCVALHLNATFKQKVFMVQIQYTIKTISYGPTISIYYRQ